MKTVKSVRVELGGKLDVVRVRMQDGTECVLSMPRGQGELLAKRLQDLKNVEPVEPTGYCHKCGEPVMLVEAVWGLYEDGVWKLSLDGYLHHAKCGWGL